MAHLSIGMHEEMTLQVHDGMVIDDSNSNLTSGVIAEANTVLQKFNSSENDVEISSIVSMDPQTGMSIVDSSNDHNIFSTIVTNGVHNTVSSMSSNEQHTILNVISSSEACEQIPSIITANACSELSTISTNSLSNEIHSNHEENGHIYVPHDCNITYQQPEPCCKMCDEMFANTDELRQHMKTHIGDKLFGCALCDAAFVVPEELRDHIIECHKEVILRVPKKKAKVKPYGSAQQTEDKVYNCAFCNETFISSIQLREHLKITHGSKKPTSPPHEEILEEIHYDGSNSFLCGECNLEFYEEEDFDFHLLTHYRENAYICGLCSLSYDEVTGLKDHVQSNHFEKSFHKVSLFKCQFCNKIFASKKSLDKHIPSHISDVRNDNPNKENVGNFVCNVCGLSFRKKANLSRHMDGHHMDEFMMEIDIKEEPGDEMNTTESISLENILSQEVVLEEVPMTLPINPFVTDDKPNGCSHCSMCFRRVAALKKHINDCHQKEGSEAGSMDSVIVEQE